MVRGVRCPIVGNVCMDSCMVDVTEAGADVAAYAARTWQGCRAYRLRKDLCRDAQGHTATEGSGLIPVSDVAEAVGTIPYEILTSVSPRVKRVYYRE